MHYSLAIMVYECSPGGQFARASFMHLDNPTGLIYSLRVNFMHQCSRDKLLAIAVLHCICISFTKLDVPEIFEWLQQYLNSYLTCVELPGRHPVYKTVNTDWRKKWPDSIMKTIWLWCKLANNMMIKNWYFNGHYFKGNHNEVLKYCFDGSASSHRN